MKLDEQVITRAIIERFSKKFLDHLAVDVAVVGGGPAGLVAAYYLARGNYKVALFERKLSIGGGRWGDGMMFNEIVVQEEGKRILDEFGIRCREYEKGYYTKEYDYDVAVSLVKGKLPKCDLYDGNLCKHSRWKPCVHGTGMKRTPLLNFTKSLSNDMIKKIEEVKGERLLMLLGNNEATLQFASDLHKERLRQAMKAKNNPLAEGLDMEHMLPYISDRFERINGYGLILSDIDLNDEGLKLQYAFFLKDLVSDEEGSIPAIISKYYEMYTIFLETPGLG